MMKYGSDLVVDLLKEYGIPYAAMNPGATFRGIHDSIVNYGGNVPEIIECPHEEIAVQVAHGYAKATGKPMVAMVHNVVGLLHSNLAVYYAYLDRVPILILGATGPMAVARRRPRLDWDHTAVMQANAIRDYIKWDDQPYDAEGIVHSFARGYRIARTEPAGPIYLCYDVALQEDVLAGGVALPLPDKAKLYTRIGIEREAVQKTVDYLLGAKNPVVIADMMGRNHESVALLIQLAELLAAPVIDLNGRMNFPNTHPLYAFDRSVLREADLVLSLDVRDLHGFLAATDDDDRPTGGMRIASDCKVIEIDLRELEINGWSQHAQRFQPVDLAIMADTNVALQELIAACQSAAGRARPDSSLSNREKRMQKFAAVHSAQRSKWREAARQDWDKVPMTPLRMLSEVWEVIKGKDWVLTANTVKGWARKLWDFDRPYRHPGRSLGTATQIGISLGVALAHKGSGRLVVDIQPDGDLMYDAGALWVAAHHHIPMLAVMYNNRAYYNSWDHQKRLAVRRKRSQENVSTGVEINHPAPDFAALARSLGWYAEGPIENGDELGGALKRAIKVIEEENRPALVDAVTQFR